MEDSEQEILDILRKEILDILERVYYKSRQQPGDLAVDEIDLVLGPFVEQISELIWIYKED